MGYRKVGLFIPPTLPCPAFPQGTSHSAISSLNSPTAVRMRHCFIIFLHNLLTPLLCSMRHARVYFRRLSSANYDSAGDPFRRTTDTHYLSTGYRGYQLSARLMYNPATGEHSCFFLLLQGSLSSFKTSHWRPGRSST
ncbi:uncharacterized protein CCOS01_16688 [Colletotrichum costaricense]|uniref:Uncharacterized protein n=1 Tax=Colletotrichum costaricense TaxID=1209916 RepID=A0AAI9YF66_9PEZI|nr:uncharacterized protein CCOS01_16688 [Colletotrichum costaricense]KAI3536867.1 hypothetical protein CSPX01_10567 [Colletotrichum filicis]KAK1505998.1 hypothetical protein CCOS01_16688 [Colletotrichum costaricense]